MLNILIFLDACIHKLVNMCQCIFSYAEYFDTFRRFHMKTC